MREEFTDRPRRETHFCQTNRTTPVLADTGGVDRISGGGRLAAPAVVVIDDGGVVDCVLGSLACGVGRWPWPPRPTTSGPHPDLVIRSPIAIAGFFAFD